MVLNTEYTPENIEKALALEKARGWFVGDFLTYIAIERNLAKRTVKEYERDLKSFFEFFSEEFEDGLTLLQIDTRTIREYLEYLRSKKDYSPQGLNRKIACLKSYFAYLVMDKYLVASPMTDIHSAKGGRLLPKVLGQSDIEQILTTARDLAQNKGDWMSVRNWAILELFYSTGMRLAELAGCNLSDLDLSEYRVRVTGKGNKQRFVLFNQATAEAIACYLHCRPNTKDQAVFLNRYYARLSGRAVEIIFDKVKAEAGVFTDASPHTIRHSFATHMLEGGSDLVTIKELMGHSSLQTTQVYTNISRVHMRDVYDKSHPRK